MSNLQPSCRWYDSIAGVLLEMVGRAGFQLFELTLRVEPATILSMV
ncbi:TPA: hypothetical protein ACS7XC_001061 [Providencia alcalifaciens]